MLITYLLLYVWGCHGSLLPIIHCTNGTDEASDMHEKSAPPRVPFIKDLHTSLLAPNPTIVTHSHPVHSVSNSHKMNRVNPINPLPLNFDYTVICLKPRSCFRSTHIRPELSRDSATKEQTTIRETDDK